MFMADEIWYGMVFVELVEFLFPSIFYV